ncbi:sulfite exporter TauE/SafE family protein [Corynebacterium vitaeruminis]|uniref:sulfite exporter TauE/SafE family protein n=1 Tax=Corynebacterium vitaeruminis TaxID=38305 RepID=UPI0023F2110C|nr:sulfite exporter TauE/SafE family protein [Corynebacterium vitaeruminis]
MTLAIIVFFVVLLGSLVQRVSGMGLGLVGGPILSIFLGPIQGILVINVLAVVNAILTTYSVRKGVDWRKFATIASPMIIGALPGALLIKVISGSLLQVIVGGLLLIALAVVAFSQNRIPKVHGTGPAVTAGVIGGFMNTLAGIAGPAITVYAQASRWEQRSYASTLQPIFIVSGSVSILVKTLTGAGSISHLSPLVWVFGIAAMFVGIFVGARISDRVPRDKARTMALILASLGGVSALVRGAMGLF